MAATALSDLEVGDYAVFYLRDEQGIYAWGGTVQGVDQWGDGFCLTVRHCHPRCDGDDHDTSCDVRDYGPNQFLRAER